MDAARGVPPRGPRPGSGRPPAPGPRPGRPSTAGYPGGMSESRPDAADRSPAAGPATLPAGRYDEAGPVAAGLTGKVVAVILVLLVGAVVVGGAITLYRFSTTEDITGTMIGFTVVDDEKVDFTLDVTRDDPSTPAYCIVRAQEYNKAEVGRREIFVPPSEEGTVRLEGSFATLGKAYVADVYGCGADVPSYLGG